MHSQNNEEEIILKYFGDFVGSLLDIGANDGITLSNSRALMERGWRGNFVEPSPAACKRLSELYASSMQGYIYNFAIVREDYPEKKITLHESGEHLGKGDTALLSSVIQSETERWKKETFRPVEVYAVPFSLIKDNLYAPLHFITIDAEGMDWDILQQIDLTETRMLCIEWNQNAELKQQYTDYCNSFGLKFHYQTHENLIFAR
jgi:FkbM family methyltransferase